MLSTIFGIGAGIGGRLFDNFLAGQRADRDREANHYYNEVSAEAAYRRQKELYTDFYSPQAQMRQIKEAGLSPSVYFGGTPGQGGMSAPQGQGVSIQTPYMPMSLLEGAQIANIQAQTKKTEAETANINEDTNIKEIQKEWQEMQKNEYKIEFEAITGYVKENGENMSYYEYADYFQNYDQFASHMAKVSGQLFSSEKGQRILRSIWIARKHFDTQIAILSNEEVNAKFQEDLLKAMRSEEFIKLNAKSAVGYLKANIGTAELTERQKNAWLRLLDKFGDEGDWKQDLIIVLGMIVNNAASNWKMPTINHNVTNNTSTVNQF